MPCACGGGSDDSVAEFEVRLPNGDVQVVKGKIAAEMLVSEKGGGLIKKRV